MRLSATRPTPITRWAGPIDDLVFAITPDASVRYQKLSGECHVMAMPSTLRTAMAKDPDINLMQQEGLNVGYLAYNTRRPPTTIRRLRRLSTRR